MIPFPELPSNPSDIQYFWFKLPFAIPGFLTFIVGLLFSLIGILAIQRTKDRPILFAFIVFSFSFACLGLVLGLRSVLQDLDLLLKWNRILYFGVVWLTPSAFLFTYLVTDRSSRTLLVTSWICLGTVFYAYLGLLTGNDFSGKWFTYNFGIYPIANLPIKVWGATTALGYLCAFIPMTIQFIRKRRESFLAKKNLFFSLHMCALLVMTNFPSLSGFPIFPLSSFAFLPLVLVGYSIFRSDFLNINELFFQQRGLFKFISVLTITGLILIAFCSALYLNPEIHRTPYLNPYFLIPLFSAVCVFALAIYIAGSNPDQRLSMLAATSLILSGVFTIIMVLFKLDLPLLVTRRIEQIFYTAFIFVPGVHLRFSFTAMGKYKPKVLRLVDLCSFILAFIVWTPYFFEGFYNHPLGMISAGGLGLNLFGLLGFITTLVILYHYYQLRKTEKNQIAKYVIFSLLFGDFLILLNLPATLGIPIYTFGELQFIPAFLIAFSVFRIHAIPVSGEATTIGNQMSILILLFVPMSMGFYWLGLTNTVEWDAALYHTLLVSSPIGLAFYLVSFVSLRPTAIKIDKAVKELAEEKIKTEKALIETESTKMEIESINHLTRVLNSQLDLKIIFKEISKFVYEKYQITTIWLFLPDEKKQTLKSFEIETYIPASEESYEFAKNLQIPLSEEGGIAYSVWKRKNSLYLPRITKFAFEFDRKTVENTGAKSILHVPLVVQEECIGLLTFSNIEDEMKLTRKQIHSIETLCTQVAGVINRVHLLKETEKQKADMIALNSLVKDLNANLEIDQIMKKVHKYVKDQFGIQYYNLCVADADRKILKIISIDAPNVDVESIRKQINEFSFPIKGSRGTRAFAIRNKKPLYFPNVSYEMKRWMSELDIWTLENFRVTSFVFLPLLLNKEVIGILELTNSEEPMNLSEDDLTRLSILCEQLAGILYSSALYKEVQISRNIAEEERRKNENLLLNILPADIAKELKEKGATEPVLYENVSVMFTDFKGFTQIAEILTPQELIRDLDACFVQFDKITERYNLEKLKTIGDSYMCAGGIPNQNKTHAIDSVLAALEIQSFMNLMKQIKAEQGLPYWELRLGIHSGPLVAGVIGEKKFAYDVWGDTVNSASRMESSGTPGMINISSSTYEMVKDLFVCEYRGQISAKNKGEVGMYYVIALKPEYQDANDERMPNEKFWQYYELLDGTIESVA